MIAREITKLHERFYRGSVNNLNVFKTPIKGELTIVISEKKIKDKLIDESEIIKKQNFLKKYSLKDVVEILFKTEDINKKKIYKICLEIKKNEKIFSIISILLLTSCSSAVKFDSGVNITFDQELSVCK